jgi:hypothetical protein
MNKITKSIFAVLCILALGQDIKTSGESKVGDSVEAIFMGFNGANGNALIAEGMTHAQFLTLVRTALGLAPGVVFEVSLMTDDGVENLADPAVFAANPQWYSESPFMVMTAADIATAHARAVATAAAAAIQDAYGTSDEDYEDEYEEDYDEEFEEGDEDSDDALANEFVAAMAEQPVDEDDSSSTVASEDEEKQEDSDTSGELIQEDFNGPATG